MNLKVMFKCTKDVIPILVVIDKATKFMVTLPNHPSGSEEKGDALIEHMFSKHSTLECVIMDQGSAFMPTLINYLFGKLGIKIKTVTPYSHQSFQAESGIKSLATYTACDRYRTILAKIVTTCNVQ